MGADISRLRSNPLLDFAAVHLKQGAVVLDADFNELANLVDRRIRAAVSDIVGRHTVSSSTPDAFRISVGGGGLLIGKGRLYVDGLLAENHGAESADPAQKLFDPSLAETQFVAAVPYDRQPYLPNPPALPERGRFLVYLDVWDREVTHLQDPDLIEVAVGVETSARRQIVWQVRLFPADASDATCATIGDAVEGWSSHIAPSAGRLTIGTFDVPPGEDPCELPPTGGYRGFENQTYRVEIHDPGQANGTATFKWSRDNASVGTVVASMISASELQLPSLGRDDVLRFSTGDWVEILDDERELSQRPGEIRRITVEEATRRITFTPDLPADMIPSAFPDADFPRRRKTRVLRWDQRGKVLAAAADGSTPVYEDLDAGPRGVITVPPAGVRILLEHGVTVSFAVAGSKGFRAGDHWEFVARTADASLEILEQAPPRGIHHHFAPLGIWDVVAGTITDCRTHWPPEGGKGHDCSCTACVSPTRDGSDALTIQAAVDRIRDTGGTICLAAGQYVLREPVRLAGTRGVRIRGQGPATVIVAPAGAFEVANALAPGIEDLAILSVGGPRACITAHTTLGLSLQRLVMLVVPGADRPGAAIGLSGAIVGATIRDNAVMAMLGIRSEEQRGRQHAPFPFLLTAGLQISTNVLWCAGSAVALGANSRHVTSTRIVENDVIACQQAAIAAFGLSAPGASFHIAGNHLEVGGGGIVATVDGLTIEGNSLTATQDANAQTAGEPGIALRTGLDPGGPDSCRILSNGIRGFSGAGVAIASPTAALIITGNAIDHCGNGIVCQADAQASRASIDRNHISDIGRVGETSTVLVAGVALGRAETTSVVGNTIRRVAQRQIRGPVRGGIFAIGVNRLAIDGNDIADIGPSDAFDGLGAGIMVRAPYGDIVVAGNRVARDAQATSHVNRSLWSAVMVDAPPGERLVSRLGSFVTVRVDDTRMVVLGGTRPFIVAAPTLSGGGAAAVARPASATLSGNVLAARGAAPVVDVDVQADCLFADNRCELQPDIGGAAVRLAAGTLIVSANRVQGGEPSMQLSADPRRMTVLGNITSAGIAAGGGPLGGPWEPLNVRV